MRPPPRRRPCSSRCLAARRKARPLVAARRAAHAGKGPHRAAPYQQKAAPRTQCARGRFLCSAGQQPRPLNAVQGPGPLPPIFYLCLQALWQNTGMPYPAKCAAYVFRYFASLKIYSTVFDTRTVLISTHAIFFAAFFITGKCMHRNTAVIRGTAKG